MLILERDLNRTSKKAAEADTRNLKLKKCFGL